MSPQPVPSSGHPDWGLVLATNLWDWSLRVYCVLDLLQGQVPANSPQMVCANLEHGCCSTLRPFNVVIQMETNQDVYAASLSLLISVLL